MLKVEELRDALVDHPKAGTDDNPPMGTVHMHGAKAVFVSLGHGVVLPVGAVNIQYLVSDKEDGRFVCVLEAGSKCEDCDGSGVGEWDTSMSAYGVPGGMVPSVPCLTCGGRGFVIPEVLGERTLVLTEHYLRLRHEHDQMRNILETQAQEGQAR